jgi:hypothetical protein
MRATGKSKTCVWRWQERFANEGVDGLLQDIEASHAIGSSGCAETDPRGLHLLNNQSSTRLSLSPPVIRRMRQPTGIEAQNFQSAIAPNQRLELKSADHLLTTPISQSHVRDSFYQPNIFGSGKIDARHSIQHCCGTIIRLLKLQNFCKSPLR